MIGTRTIDLMSGEFFAGDPYPDFAWMREVAVHRFNAVRSDIQALTWERDPKGTIQDIGTILPKFVQDVAQIYF